MRKMRNIPKRWLALITALSLLPLGACAANNDKGNEDVTKSIDLTKHITADIKVKNFGTVTVELYPEYAPKTVEHIATLILEGYYTGKKFHRIIADFMIQGGSLNGDGLSSPEEGELPVEANQNARHFYGAICLANNGVTGGAQFYIVNKQNKNDYAEDLTNLDTYAASVEMMNSELKKVADGEEGYTGIDERALASYTAKRDYYQRKVDWFASDSDEIKNRYAETGGVSFLDGGYTVFGYTIDGFDVLEKISAVETQPNDSGENSSPVEQVVIESITIR